MPHVQGKLAFLQGCRVKGSKKERQKKRGKEKRESNNAEDDNLELTSHVKAILKLEKR